MEKNKSSLIEKVPDMALKPRFIELTFEQMLKLSAIIENSKMFGLTKEEGFTVMMRGQELGISSMASLEVISNIKGKSKSSFAYHYTLWLALIKKNLPEAEIKWIERSDNACIVEARRDKEEDFLRFSFTIKDAETANLIGKNNWRNYPKDMCISKAVLRMGRLLFSDVLLGLKDTPETILDWKEPLVDKITKKKGKKGKDAIPITANTEEENYNWENMDKVKQEKKDLEQNKAKDAFLKASKKSTGKKLALSPKKNKKQKLKEILDEEQELQDNIDAVNDIVDEANNLFPGLVPIEKEATKTPVSDIVKPFNPKKKLGLKKKSKGIDFKKLVTKEIATAAGIDEKILETKKLSTKPALKSKREVTFTVVDDPNWEVAIAELPSFKFVEKFDLCHSKAKNKVKYDVISQGFIEIIEAYFIMYQIEEGTPFRDKFKEILKTKTKMMPVLVIYQKAFKDTFPPEHYHDLMKGFYDLTESKIKELIKTGEANVGKPGHEFWGGYGDIGYRPDHNIWIHEFLKKNNLFTVDEELVERIK